MITHLKFVGLPTKDQDKALKFWTELMGFKVMTDQPMGPGQRWIELGVGSGPTFLVLFTPEGHEDRIGSFFNGSFACDDVEATYRQLSAKGVKFTQQPKKEDWGTSALFEDWEGNKFVLSSR
jgi:catechol 2,3-dioxygenase-like lactoylglutathione lyase family enzyme